MGIIKPDLSSSGDCSERQMRKYVWKSLVNPQLLCQDKIWLPLFDNRILKTFISILLPKPFSCCLHVQPCYQNSAQTLPPLPGSLLDWWLSGPIILWLSTHLFLYFLHLVIWVLKFLESMCVCVCVCVYVYVLSTVKLHFKVFLVPFFYNSKLCLCIQAVTHQYSWFTAWIET